MKIALPTRGRQVDAHFGHCESFTIFSVDENKNIAAEEVLSPPPGCGCKSNIIPVLAEKGVCVMLAGNMGEGAVQMLGRFGIEVIRGCAGDVKKVAEDFLAGRIADAAVTCADHGSCPGH